MQVIMPYVHRTFCSLLNAVTNIMSLKKQSLENYDKRNRKIDFITLQLGYNVLYL